METTAISLSEQLSCFAAFWETVFTREFQTVSKESQFYFLTWKKKKQKIGFFQNIDRSMQFKS